MYLKSIEVQGFKSFANKIKFDFHNGITGIVGPNGSGKSNVADAVRWVLGEQRIKQLRGASMQDVIFSGSEMRKPLGFAFVAITLDNSDHSLNIDFPEVTVSRRIYRSGESEYLINGAACRLRDINELFYDTGIGKEGYSIIGQGQIDKVLSGKPEDRRELFDEAAGIVKFKRRKEASVKKLENEKQNLLRVNDILAELERQVGPLEKQSKKARIFLDKREELKDLDVNLFLVDNEETTARLKEVTTNYDIAVQNLENTKKQFDEVKNSYDRLEERISALKESIEKDRNEITGTSQTRGKLENEIGILTEQVKNAKVNESHYDERINALSGEIGEKEKERDALLLEKESSDLSLKGAQENKSEAALKLQAIQKRIEESNLKTEENKNRILSEMEKRSVYKASQSRLETLLEQNGIRKAALTSRLLEAKSEEVRQKDSIRRLEEEFAAVTEQITAEQQEIKTAEKRLQDIKGELSDQDASLRLAQERYHQEKAKLDTLQNIAERYEGYGSSVRIVMEQKGKVPGIEGVVADLIKVDKEYETAIETALGGNLQNVVTDDEDTAKRLIEYLKKVRGGRATFLPLTSIRDPQELKSDEVLKEKGVIGTADSLVTTAKKYADVPKSLLGRIVVVDTFDHAVAISRKYHYSIRMVTVSGEYFTPGGAISGGAFKNNSNLLGRRRELDELTEHTKKLEEEIGKLEQGIRDVKSERNGLRVRLETLRTGLQNTFLKQNTARIALTQAKEKMDETLNGYLSIHDEEENLKAETADIETQQKEIAQNLEASNALEAKLNAEIEELRQLLEKDRAEETEALSEVSEKEVALEKLRQGAGFLETNLTRIQEELKRLNGDLADVKTEKDKSVSEREVREGNIEKIKETIEASHTVQTETEKRLAEEIAEEEALSEKRRSSISERDTLSDQIVNLNRENDRLKAQKDRLEESLLSRARYMWDEYEITLNDAEAYRNPELTNAQEMRRQIAGLKDEIRKLGDVNVNAIEEYKELMERYTFLKGQHDDLVAAEETLTGIISDLDIAMRRQFTEKFGEIARVFDKVFKELFGGGKGSLELMEAEDILEAGIRVIAQPPGKKLQNMMQLSGGEKALTAICLLFAIQDLKPSPFCLLDEIEAALDDNNVTRFSRYLHKLTKSTQFIVITHRRGTMEAADRLYGITMQEKGVSTLVSVNLIDKELT